MKVLIVDFDLFDKIGGGQTFYRRLIEKNPQIEFYYFIVCEALSQARPANARPIVYQEKYYLSDRAFLDLTPPKWIYRPFVFASNIAACVAGKSFDIVDLPDYKQVGTMLRPALKYHQVNFERMILSMHGNISTSIKLDWFYGGKVDKTLVLQEEIQYKVVDNRYGISQTYLEEWREIVDLPSHYFNPLSIISLPQPVLAAPTKELPSLNFIGRTEKRKGPDIFVDLAWWLPRSKFSSANIIGPDSYGNKVGSGMLLYQMINNRLKDEISILPAKSYAELQQIFASKSITILPSKYDTFNLTALESLFSGCPTVIGTGAGAVRFLQETYPDLPLLTIDIHNIYSSLTAICKVLDDYENYRDRLVKILSEAEPNLSGDSLTAIYKSQPACDRVVLAEVEKWYGQLIKLQEKYNLKDLIDPAYIRSKLTRAIKNQLKPEVRKNIKQFKGLADRTRTRVKSQLKLILIKKKSKDLKILRQGLKARSFFKECRNIFNLGENNNQQLSDKISDCWRLSSEYQIDRVRIWREIARLELLRGNDVVAATYQLRCMRLLGGDRFNNLPTVISILKANGFSQEADVAVAMYGQLPDRHQHCLTILDRALDRHKLNQKWEYEFLDDRRTKSSYRVSVIVSLYNAADKLALFLQTLQHQTLIQAGAVEVILVDSGSPTDEYAVFKQLIKSLEIPILYARCPQRETIQSAWNRGIDLARSPYLTFLGVDETILPQCLEILAAELDADPALDWVQANSLVTNVDKNGAWLNDIMTYDRKDYKQDLVYLETCYLSWVGALYRRSIHERFGYYDPTFRAAGDTEFKNRILPFIKTKAIPQTLGVFRNYPDERTTQHPRAELEDLRAWYLHRTVAGIEYAFARRHPQAAEDLFYSCWQYRKSYCQHWSTDIEYACNLSHFIQQNLPNSSSLKYLSTIKTLLDAYRSLDWIPKLSQSSHPVELARVHRLVSKIERQHQAINHQAIKPMYKIFNDNRYEQHSFLWLTLKLPKDS